MVAAPSTAASAIRRRCGKVPRKHLPLARDRRDAHNARMVFASLQGGWLPAVRRCPSPNFNARPPQALPELLVVHNISLPPGCFGSGDIELLFCNQLDCSSDPFYQQLEGLEVSAHFLIDREGRLTQFVSVLDRAWHAGISSWAGRDNCNDFSVGIEVEGTDNEPYAPVQYDTLTTVIRALRKSLPSLAGGAIVGHCDIAPGRKSDPGVAFDWARLRRKLSAGRVNTE